MGERECGRIDREVAKRKRGIRLDVGGVAVAVAAAAVEKQEAEEPTMDEVAAVEAAVTGEREQHPALFASVKCQEVMCFCVLIWSSSSG